MRKKRRKGRGVRPDGRSESGEQFIKLTYSLARSPAWRSLSGPAVRVFVELRCGFNGSNNGELFLSFGDAAERLALGKTTIARAFDELVLKGFLRKTSTGNWYGRKAATWRVTTEQWKGELPTNDWRRWQPKARIENQSLGTAAVREPS